MRYHHKDKITLKRKKAAVAYYRKLKSEKENADKQMRENQNITPENLAVRVHYLRKSIDNLISVAYSCSVLGIQIPQRLYDRVDNRIGFKKNEYDHCCGLAYKNNGCEIFWFDDTGINFGFNELKIFWFDGPNEISKINADLLQDFIHSFAVFESMFYKWFDELVGFQYIV